MAFRRIGLVVPRGSWQQEEAGEGVAKAELEPGDDLCYPEHGAFSAAVYGVSAAKRLFPSLNMG